MTTNKINSASRVGFTTLIIILILSISITVSAQSGLLSEQVYSAPVENFQLVAEDQGWVLVGNQVFWTSDNSATWTEITPETGNEIRDIHFINSETGFLISQQLTYTQEMKYSLFATHDQGSTWTESTITSIPVRDPGAISKRISAFFLDAQTGWIVFQQATSVNFNIGQIWHTNDCGQSWKSAPAPLGEPASFSNQQIGFMSGGVAESNLYRTLNNSQSWEKIVLPDQPLMAVGSPNFLTASLVFVPAIQSTESGTFLLIYTSTDAGETWILDNSQKIANQADLPGQFINLPGEIKIFASNKIFTYYLTSNQLTEIQQAGVTNLTGVDFSSNKIGWASLNISDCVELNVTCESFPALVSTKDGGHTWQLITPPFVAGYLPTMAQSDFISADEVDLLSRTSFLQGQGFDQCEISSLSNLQAWKNNSPLAAVNLYIGGISRGCSNSILNVDDGPPFLEALSIQGWKFIPTWVGLQAACSIYTYKMSLDASTAYQQGWDEGIDAVRVARKLGLSEADDSGTVIYYDLEAFDTTNQTCLNAAKAFINGWTAKLHESGVTAGVYGSVCASALDEYFNLPNRPDVIWPALWTQSRYDSAVTPDSLPCVSDSEWGDHQRILQYTGAHIETWGNVSMNIDLNVIDGIVSDLSHHVGIPSTTLQNPSFETGALPDWEIQNNPADCNWQVAQSTEVAHSGDYYLSISRDQGDINCTGVSQTLTHTPMLGDRYRFAIWAKSSSSSDPRALTLKITGEGASPNAATQYFFGISNQWVCLETNYDVTSGNLTGITPEVELADSDGVDLYFDNAHVSVNTGLLCPTIPSPTGLRASSGGDQSMIALGWDAVPLAVFYEVHRSIAPDTTKDYLAQTTTTAYLDSDVTHWEDYYYWVRACSAGQCSSYSQIATGNITSPYLDFFDGFETGDTSKWTTISQPDLITACTEGSLNGEYGLCLDTNTSTAGGILTYDFVTPTREAEVGFTIDPNGFSPNGEVFNILKLYDTGNNLEAASIRLKQEDGAYKIAAYVLDNGLVSTRTNWVLISDSPTKVSIKWIATLVHARSTTPIFSGISLFVNGSEATPTVLVNNQNLIVNRLTLGGWSNIQTDQSNGIVYIDDFYYQAPLYYRP